jgi:hypothetical protein
MVFVPSSRFRIENGDSDINDVPPPHERRGEFWLRVSGLLCLARPETTDSYGADAADADLLAMRRREARIRAANQPPPPGPLASIVGDAVDMAKDAVKTVAEAIPRRGRKPTAAINWLGKGLKRDFLTEKEVRASAAKEGYRWKTIIRAKKTLGVKSIKKSYGRMGYWIWKLPEGPEKTTGK